MSRTALPETGGKSPSQSRFSAGMNTGRPEADAAIAPLLARANLLKHRGQWEEAVAVSTEAIRRTPESASAHAVLGDIYLAQGKNRDALHWYRMALDRNSQLPGIAQKHDELLAEQRAVATGGFTTTNLGGINKTQIPGDGRLREDRTAQLVTKTSPVLIVRSSGRSTGRITVERTLDWFDRVFPQGRDQGVSRIFYVITGLLTTLVIALGAFLFFALKKPYVSDEQNTVLSEVRPVNNIPAIAIPPATQAPPVGSVVPPTPAATPAQTLIDKLSGLNSSELTVTAAQADPAGSQVQLEIALASHSGESVVDTRGRILLLSAKAAQAAYTIHPTLQRFSVRVLLRGRGVEGVEDAVNANLVFVGETSGIALRTLSSTPGTPDKLLLSALFTNTWWANSLSVHIP